MTIKLLLAAIGTVALLSIGVVHAETAPPAKADKAAKTTTPPAKSEKTEKTAKPAAKPRTAKSIECSKQADAKGLHGKARRKFREECKKG